MPRLEMISRPAVIQSDSRWWWPSHLERLWFMKSVRRWKIPDIVIAARIGVWWLELKSMYSIREHGLKNQLWLSISQNNKAIVLWTMWNRFEYYSHKWPQLPLPKIVGYAYHLLLACSDRLPAQFTPLNAVAEKGSAWRYPSNIIRSCTLSCTVIKQATPH